MCIQALPSTYLCAFKAFHLFSRLLNWGRLGFYIGLFFIVAVQGLPEETLMLPEKKLSCPVVGRWALGQLCLCWFSCSGAAAAKNVLSSPSAVGFITEIGLVVKLIEDDP